MNNRDYISSIITQFSGQNNVIPIPVVYIEMTEDYPSAALLNQMIYWSDRTSREDGFFYKSYNDWYEELHLTEYQVRRATNKLKSFGFVETSLKKANGAPTLHYKVDTKEISEWILKKLKNGNLRNLGMDTEETKESLTENTTKITNNSRVDFIPYKKIIDHLNKKTGKRFSHKSKANRKLIKARFNEGYTLNDFINVIDTKTNEWKDVDKMKGYLQPTTLFGNKFDKYLNQEVVNQDEVDTDIFDSKMKELFGE
ncbi:conserved phage C-terminal domain-containing protein [Staphylococcus pettenkoferi]|uniref:conserved phage C-terminal domain-containing protein n=1 Tax=Staphylococcus pettenkoferi TaxID=170573 RepID=UPI0011A55014|nr:conserved phage C-terminal domain-containing protein [Staphylococcus pettenkoferi]